MDKGQKRVCICNAKIPFMSGGAEVLVESLAMQLRNRGFVVEIIDVPFKWYPEYEAVNGAMAWRLIDLEEANGQKIDLVIATKFPTYAVKHSNKVTWLVHQFRAAYDLYESQYGLSNNEGGEELRKLITNIDNQALPESKKIYTISKNVTGRLKKFNAIDSEPLYHPPKLAEQLHSESYGDYILSVGRLDPLKRLDLLINALKHCNPNVKAIIAGTGMEADSLRALARENNVEDRVEFPGFVSDEDAVKLYAGCFAVYFAPFDEDYGYVTLESFLSKKPVVTCVDSGGVLEFAIRNENACISDPEPKEVAESINKLFSDKKKCIALGENGYEKIKGITWDNAIEKLTCTL